ncbi:MAG: Lipoprotein [Ramlibacter sp.]|jgi:hypothetical protein|nr:Lipoprotein [Ramlibacter sp.]
MRVLAAVAAACVLAGCATTTTVTLSQRFDAEVAEKMLKPGANAVTGSALIRQKGGGVVTCAGFKVHLVPVTAYAEERMRAIYGGGKHADVSRRVTFTPDEPAYRQHTRETTCNAQGFFRFDNVSDGDFFVTSVVVWKVGQYEIPQGGGLMQRVTLKGGQTVDLTLSP